MTPGPRQFFQNRRDITVLLASIAILVLLTLPKLGSFYIMDEVEFVKSGQAINQGERYVYIGEQMARVNWLWHPPLFVYLMSLVERLGSAEHWNRGFILFTNILSLITLFFIARLAFAEKWKQYATALLFSTHPLVLRSATLIEIDGSIMMLFILLYFYFVIRYLKQNKASTIGISLFLFLTMWSKLQYMPMLFASLILAFTCKEKMRGAIKAILISSGVTASFIATWLIVAFHWQLDTLGFLNNNSTRFLGMIAGTFGSNFINAAWSLKGTLLWIGLPLAVLYCIHLLKRIRELFRQKNLLWTDPLDTYVLLGFCFFTLMGYNAYGFPKPFVALLPIALITSLDGIDISALRKNIRKLIGISAIAVAYMLIFVKDPFVKQNMFYIEGRSYIGSTQMMSDNLAAIHLVVPVLVFLLFAIFLHRKNFMNTLQSLMIALVTANSLYIAAVQIEADYSTTYFYGQHGLGGVVDYLGSQDLGKIIVSRTDIGYYSKQRFIQTIPQFPEEYVPCYEKYKQDIDLLILTPPDSIGYFNGSFIKESQIGDFSIYRVDMHKS